MYIKNSQYQAIGSPSKIEGAGGSMIIFEIQPQKYHLSHYFIPLYLRGGKIDTQLFNYSNRYNRNLNKINVYHQ